MVALLCEPPFDNLLKFGWGFVRVMLENFFLTLGSIDPQWRESSRPKIRLFTYALFCAFILIPTYVSFNYEKTEAYEKDLSVGL